MISFGSSISALKTLEARQAVTSTRVANINTKDFQESSVNQTLVAGSQGSPVSPTENVLNSSQQFSGTKLEVDIPQQMMIQNSYKANASVIKTQDEMIGSLMDIVS